MQNKNVKAVICPPCGESTLRGGKGVLNKAILFDNPPSALRATSPTGGEVNGGFTLIELLVVVLIIGILAAVAVPQYQKAVYKSRYSALMPITKSVAVANEAYYLGYGSYATLPSQLSIETGTGTSVPQLQLTDNSTLSYVQAQSNQVPNMRYLVYQKHSATFPDTTQCEAADKQTQEICKNLGGQELTGNSDGNRTSPWKAFLLTGTLRPGDEFKATDGCSFTVPEDLVSKSGKVRGKATSCENGKWKYTWTGGQEYNATTGACQILSAYECGGSNYTNTVCHGYVANQCSGSTFGTGANCYGYNANACADTTVTTGGMCYETKAHGCAESLIQGGGRCITLTEEGCDGARYTTNQQGDLGCCEAHGSHHTCVAGAPKCGSWNENKQAYNISGWWGDCCDPDIVSACPANVMKC